MELNSNKKRPVRDPENKKAEIPGLGNVRVSYGDEDLVTGKPDDAAGNGAAHAAGQDHGGQNASSAGDPAQSRETSSDKATADVQNAAGNSSAQNSDTVSGKSGRNADDSTGDTYRTRKGLSGKRETKGGSSSGTEKKNRGSSLLPGRSLKSIFTGIPDGATGEDAEYRRQLTAPILVLAVFILLRLSGIIDSRLTRENEYAAVILLEILIFLVPAAIYLALSKNTTGLRLRPFGIGHLLLIVAAVLVIESGSILLNCLFGGYETISQSYDLWGIFISKNDGSASDILYLILAYAILPAISEEFVFRSILCREYEKRSTTAAILMPSLFFAMLHFDLSRFPSFFFAGVILALTMYSSRSVFAAVFVHMGCNLIALFSRSYLVTLYDLGGGGFFVFVMTVIFLLFGFIFFAEASRLYRNYTSGGYSDSYRKMLPPPVTIDEAEINRADPTLVFASKHPRLAATISAFLSPTALICYIFFAVFIMLF